MSDWGIDPAGGTGFRNRRLGFALAALAVLYIAAVIAFIIIY
jgi:hypothetical protein